MKSLLIGVALGVMFTVLGLFALGLRIARVTDQQTSALHAAFASVANRSGAVWDRMTPNAQSWLSKQRWLHPHQCSVVWTDIAGAALDVECGERRGARMWFDDGCEGTINNALRYFKLRACAPAPKLERIAVKESAGPSVVVFARGAPLD